MKFFPLFRTLALLAGAVFIFSLLLRTLQVTYPSTEQRLGNRNVGELVGQREVGQTFESIRPNLSAVAFQIATYGGRKNTQDVVFELRERPEDVEPLRRVVVNASAFGDHQFARFPFDPVRESSGKTYYASLRSPSSRPGDAITVDYSNTNPYEKGTSSSLVILPQQREALDTFDGTLKTPADAAFIVYHRVSGREFARLALLKKSRAAWSSLTEQPGRYWLDLRLLAMSAVLTFLALKFRGRVEAALVRPAVFPLFLGALVLLGLGFRLLYMHKLPYTNDEGSYLYDARTILERHLPGGDALAKAPIVIGSFALGIAILGGTLTIGRLVSVIAGLLTAFPLFLLARHLGGKHAGVLAAGLWLLASAPALFDAYGHTQSIQVLLTTSALAATAKALPARRRRWFLLAGFLLGLGLAARKSSLALGLPMVFLVMTESGGWRERLERIVLVGIGFAIAVTIFLSTVQALYGASGVRYATGLDLAKTSLEQLGDRGDLYATYSVKGVLPFFRESLPLIFLGLAMLGRGGEQVLRRYGRLFGKAGWLLPLALAWWSGVFLQRFEEEVHFSYGLWPFWVVMSIALVLLAFLPLQRSANEPQDPRGHQARFPVLFPVLWFLSVGLFYAFWIKFHANYLLEFLPALVTLGALGAQWLTKALPRRSVLGWGLAVLLLWGSYSAAQSGYHFEHTGTFHWSSITEAADYLRKHVPPSDPVLTGAVIIPYLSGHHVPFDVAHPTWYGYGYIEPELRNVFMASAEQMVGTVVHDVRWVVLERLTAFSYLREYTDIERTLERSFVEVAEIENLSNPITILERRN